MNEVSKTRIGLEVKDLKERGDTVNKIMGKILEDMTTRPQEKYHKEPPEPVEGEEEDDEGPLTLEEAREVGDWLFIFEAARETHMIQGVTNDRVLMYEK